MEREKIGERIKSDMAWTWIVFNALYPKHPSETITVTLKNKCFSFIRWMDGGMSHKSIFTVQKILTRFCFKHTTSQYLSDSCFVLK